MEDTKTVKELIQKIIDAVAKDKKCPMEFLEATRDELEFTLPILFFSLRMEREYNPYIAAFQMGIIATIIFLKKEFGEDFVKELRSDYDREDLPI